jgi:GTP cyclohydrolase I
MDLLKAEKHIRAFLEEGVGVDLADPNLKDTPARVARMYCTELLCNTCKNFQGLTTFPNEDNCDQIVLLDRIFYVSVCSHHLLPFTGHAWVGYIPDKLLVGASKPARLIEHHAARPQLQERLCEEVISAFAAGVRPKGVGVLMRGVHGCMKCRGVRQTNGAGMVTSALWGSFKEPSVKAEFFKLVELSMMETST